MDPEWIDLPGGRFWMGGGPRDNENPRHEVRVSAVPAGPDAGDARGVPGLPRRHRPAGAAVLGGAGLLPPAHAGGGPSWEDAAAFCAWRRAAGTGVRLPTEAEWEHAARAGRDVLYPYGDDPPESLPDYGRRWLGGPEPVDAYPSLHPLGFLGLGENVHEWCADWYDPRYYEASPVDDPRGPASGVRRASRGGSWRHQIKVSRCAARSAIPPGDALQRLRLPPRRGRGTPR